MPTPLLTSNEEGARVARYQALTFRREGAPLFLKHDLGSPLKRLAVDKVLERHRVLPLKGPQHYPPFYGSIERSMRDLKAALDQRPTQALVTHALNHRRLRSLGGLTGR